MTSFKLMPDPLDLREVTFTNLLLLGFNPEANEAQYRIPFTRYDKYLQRSVLFPCMSIICFSIEFLFGFYENLELFCLCLK